MHDESRPMIIQKILTPKIEIVDSATSTACHVKKYLIKQSLTSPNKKIVSDKYFVSDKMVRFSETANMFLKQKIKKIIQIDL